MSQVTNKHEGSFGFPAGLKKDPAIVPPSSSALTDEAHAETISKAKSDREKAEELIASFGEDAEKETSFISFADDDEQLRPGDFAAADPYVNTADNNAQDIMSKNEAMENNQTPSGLVGLFNGADATGNLAGVTNLSALRAPPVFPVTKMSLKRRRIRVLRLGRLSKRRSLPKQRCNQNHPMMPLINLHCRVLQWSW